MLRRVWDNAPPDGLRCVWQGRAAPGGPDGICWDPLGAAPVCDRLDRADVILNLLGVTAGDATALALNTPLALAGLDAAAALGARRCLVASSAAVYGPATNAAEERSLAPATAYGHAKAAMEAAVTQRDMPGTVLLRIGNVAGADALLGRARAGHPAVLDRFADGGGPVRSYVGPVDLGRAVAALAVARTLPPVLNLAAPAPVAMADLLAAAGIHWHWRPAPTAAVHRVTLNTARLRDVAPLPARAADPAEIVAQWRAAGAGR